MSQQSSWWGCAAQLSTKDAFGWLIFRLLKDRFVARPSPAEYGRCCSAHLFLKKKTRRAGNQWRSSGSNANAAKAEKPLRNISSAHQLCKPSAPISSTGSIWRWSSPSVTPNPCRWFINYGEVQDIALNKGVNSSFFFVISHWCRKAIHTSVYIYT